MMKLLFARAVEWCHAIFEPKGDTLKMLKLPMPQRVCEGLELDAPQSPVRRRAPYMELLKDITQNCSCQQ